VPSLYPLLEKRLSDMLTEAKDTCAFANQLPGDVIRWHQGRASALVDALAALSEANKDAER
jgi:hypothetical protein